MRSLLAVSLAIVGLVLLAACNSSTTSSAAPQPGAAASNATAQMVSVQASDALKFEPSSITAAAHVFRLPARLRNQV